MDELTAKFCKTYNDAAAADADVERLSDELALADRRLHEARLAHREAREAFDKHLVALAMNGKG